MACEWAFSLPWLRQSSYILLSNVLQTYLLSYLSIDGQGKGLGIWYSHFPLNLASDKAFKIYLFLLSIYSIKSIYWIYITRNPVRKIVRDPDLPCVSRKPCLTANPTTPREPQVPICHCERLAGLGEGPRGDPCTSW